jgi:hypothetical protein
VEFSVGKVFTQVEVYITDDRINLSDVLILIAILEIVFGNPDYITMIECKLKALKQTNYYFFTYDTEFQYYTANVQ